MKKLFAIIFIAFFCLPVYAAQKSLAFDGRGYVGTLPDLTRQYQPTEPKSTKPVIEQVENAIVETFRALFLAVLP